MEEDEAAEAHSPQQPHPHYDHDDVQIYPFQQLPQQPHHHPLRAAYYTLRPQSSTESLDDRRRCISPQKPKRKSSNNIFRRISLRMGQSASGFEAINKNQI